MSLADAINETEPLEQPVTESVETDSLSGLSVEEHPDAIPGNRFTVMMPDSNLIGYGPTPEDAKAALIKQL